MIEILTENEFFDYEAKYNGHSKEVCPAQIPDSLREEIQETSKKIYAHLGCSGLVRVDYICAEDGLYFLEVNTIPGMTAASLVLDIIIRDGRALSSPEPYVRIDALADSAVVIEARAWVLNSEYWGLYDAVTEAFYKELPKHGANFPFPQLDVHLTKE